MSAGPVGWYARLGVYLFAAVGAPVGLAAAEPQAVLDRPLVSVAALIGWEVLCFVGQVAADVADRRRGRLADLVDRTLDRRLSRFEHRYREYLVGYLRSMETKGLIT